MPVKRVVRITGAAARKPVDIPASNSHAGRTGSARAVLAGGWERTGYTHSFVKDLVEKAPGGIDAGTKQSQDPYSTAYGSGFAGISSTFMWPVQPYYNFNRLCELVISNNALGMCIDAYVTNIESYGYQLEYIGKEGQEDKPAVQAEKARLEAFLSFVSPEHSLREVREFARRDRETTGNAFFECARNQRGEYTLFDHMPTPSMRITRKDPQPVEVDVQVPDPENPGKYKTHRVLRYFRRFVQMTPTFKKIYFKELGDPRPISSISGEVDETLEIEDQATEVLWVYNYTPGFLYGLPRWVGQMPAILGSRESEMVNLNFFRENAIPAMVVLVSGGALTQESYDKVVDYVNAVRGQRAMNRVMVLEASVDDSMGSIDHSQPAPRIDIKPMISERQQEGLFQDYDQKNIQKVRASFRLPPIFSGRSEDYTRASAYASMEVAETQIFMPERSAFDQIFNQRILGSYRPRYYRFKSLAPRMVDAASISAMVTSLGNQGGLTPNIAIKLVNQVLNVQVEPVLAEWGDYPMDLLIEYVRAGAVIKGMDEFIEKFNDAGGGASGTGTGTTASGTTLKPKPVPRRTPATKLEMDLMSNVVKEEFRAEIADMIERLVDARLESLQVS